MGESWRAEHEPSGTTADDWPIESTDTDPQVCVTDDAIRDGMSSPFRECDGGESGSGESVEVEWTTDGGGLVWCAEHVISLWRRAAVLGRLSGCLAGAPRQSLQQSVPLLLSRAEMEVLFNLNAICRIVSVPLMSQPPALYPCHLLDLLRQHESQCLLEQSRWIRSHRYRQLLLRSSHIVAAKLNGLRRRMSDAQRQEICDLKLRVQVEDQLMSSVHEPKLDQCYLQLHRQCPLQLPTESATRKGSQGLLAATVFEDLWRRGYWLTDGLKFGGDYMAYIGDPLLLHASFIVVCWSDNSRPLPIAQLAATQRLARNCVKSLVVASWANTHECKKGVFCCSEVQSVSGSNQPPSVHYRFYSRHSHCQMRSYVRSFS